MLLKSYLVKSMNVIDQGPTIEREQYGSHIAVLVDLLD